MLQGSTTFCIAISRKSDGNRCANIFTCATWSPMGRWPTDLENALSFKRCGSRMFCSWPSDAGRAVSVLPASPVLPFFSLCVGLAFSTRCGAKSKAWGLMSFGSKGHALMSASN